MTTMSKVLDDSKSVADVPPSYETISASASCTGSQPSIFSLLRTMHKRKSVLSRIRDIASGPNFTPSSVTPIVRACADALSPAVFSHLLQIRNIEGHTALYWAIVNNRQEAFSAFTAFTPRFSSVGRLDLRLACMTTNNQALFAQLDLDLNYSPKDEPLRHSLGCPSDEVQVHEEDGPCWFVVHIRIRLFQKRLRITRSTGVEFVARGRIWRLHFYMEQSGISWIGVGLSRYSLCAPARLHCDIMIKAHTGGEPGCASKPAAYERWWHRNMGHIGWVPPSIDKTWDNPNPNLYVDRSGFLIPFHDWVMDDNTAYVDCDGTLHAVVEMTLK